MSNITSISNSRRFQNVFDAGVQAAELAPAVAAAIVEDLQPALREGETMPDFVLVQKLLGRRLSEASAGLDEVDNARKHNRNLDRIRKERLEAVTLKLREALVDVRYILDRILSEKAAKAVFEGRSKVSRLKTPVIERVSTRLLSLFDDPKTGWEQVPDPGYRATAEASRLRLQQALTEFLEVLAERQPERSALVLAQGSFDRAFQEERRKLQRRLRHLRGLYEGAGFEREAAGLAFRRRAAPQKAEEAPGPVPPASPAGMPPKSGAAASAAGPPAAAPSPPTDSVAEAPVRRRRRRSRRRAKTAEQGVPPTA